MPMRMRDAGIPVAQVALVVCGLAAMALLPTKDGNALVVPVSPWAQSSANFVSDHGWRILARGPTENSLVISGAGRAAIWPALRHGLVVVAALPILCGRINDR